MLKHAMPKHAMPKHAVTALLLTAAVAMTGCTAATEKPAAVKHKAGSSTHAQGGKSSGGPSDAAAKDQPQIGDTVEVGNWDVKVTDLNLHAAPLVAQANMFNDKPKFQYVLVTYTAKYTGPDRVGDTMADLSWTFTTNDQKVNDQASEVTPADDQEWPTEARHGGTVKGQALFDLPAPKLKGGILTVETYDDSFDKVYADFTV